jgi:hypothetical protein
VSRSNNAPLLLNWLSLKWSTRYQKFVPWHRNQWFHIQLRHYSQMVHGADCSYRWHHDGNVTTNNVTGTIFLHPLVSGVRHTDGRASWPAEGPDYCHHSRQYKHTSRNTTFSQQSYWQCQSFGTWSSVTGHAVPNVLKDRTAFTLGVNQSKKKM